MWYSDVNGHSGRLRCFITPLTNDVYSAKFHATYQRIIPLSSRYIVFLQVRSQDGEARFVGEADLGWFGGGGYHYQGSLTPNHFFAAYSSKLDHGTFQMSRPP